MAGKLVTRKGRSLTHNRDRDLGSIGHLTRVWRTLAAGWWLTVYWNSLNQLHPLQMLETARDYVNHIIYLLLCYVWL